MNAFNRLFPWVLTCTAILAVASGMNASPAMMTVSGKMGGIELCIQREVPFSGDVQNCVGDVDRDGIYRLTGQVNSDNDPLIFIRHSLDFGQMHVKHSTQLVNR